MIGSESTPAPPPTPVADVTAVEFEAAYRANEYRADEQFKGKLVRVTGVVDRIGKDIAGHPDVMLHAGDAGVLCSFDGPDDNLLGLDPGSRATLRGVGAGYHLATPLLQSCSVDEVHGPPCDVPNADGKGPAHGECRRDRECGGVYYKGYCDGPADVVCCVRQ
jgi:hypothetical protein